MHNNLYLAYTQIFSRQEYTFKLFFKTNWKFSYKIFWILWDCRAWKSNVFL